MMALRGFALKTRLILLAGLEIETGMDNVFHDFHGKKRHVDITSSIPYLRFCFLCSYTLLLLS